MKYFTKDHEWIEINGDVGTVGVTDYAQKQLGDVVYVSLTKEINADVSIGEDVVEIESVKSVNQVFAPISGKLIEFNSIFQDESNSGIINQDPYEKGWIFKLSIQNKDQTNNLMNEFQYNEYIKTL